MKTKKIMTVYCLGNLWPTFVNIVSRSSRVLFNNNNNSTTIIWFILAYNSLVTCPVYSLKASRGKMNTHTHRIVEESINININNNRNNKLAIIYKWLKTTITIACHKMMNESRKKNYLARHRIFLIMMRIWQYSHIR